jgi:hypothetical protein
MVDLEGVEPSAGRLQSAAAGTIPQAHLLKASDFTLARSVAGLFIAALHG